MRTGRDAPGTRRRGRLRYVEEGGEALAEELGDLRFARVLVGGVEFTESLADLAGFEMNSLDLVIRAAPFDGGPIDNPSGARHRVAQVGLLEDFIEPGAGLAIGDELVRGQGSAARAVDDIEETEFDGVQDGDAVVQIPRGQAGASLLGELVEESVLAFMSRPHRHVVAPGDAALGGLPEELGIGVFGEFVEADIAAIDGHGLGMGGEGKNAGFVVELDVADFDFFGERSRPALGIEAGDFQVILAMRDDGAGEVEETSEIVSQEHVFQGARIILGGEEIIAVREAQAFADVFESVAVGPADADGFFGEGKGRPFLGV